MTHALAVRVLGGDLGSVPLADTAALVSSPVDVSLPGPGTVAGFSGRRVDRQVRPWGVRVCAGAGGGLSPTSRPLSLQAFFKYVSFLDPGLIMRLDFGAGTALLPESVAVADPRSAAAAPLAVLTPWQSTRLAGFDASEFTATQSFVKSTDGTAQIPIFVVRRKTAEAGPRPTLLYGYGGFSESGCCDSFLKEHLPTCVPWPPARRRCQPRTEFLCHA